MGYRSEVRGIIYGRPEQIDNFLSLFKEDYSTLAGDTDRCEVIEHRADKVFHIYSDYCKWYSDYPAVMAWNKLIGLSTNFQLKSEFVRIGQDMGDVEIIQSADADDLLSYSCGIMADFDTE